MDLVPAAGGEEEDDDDDDNDEEEDGGDKPLRKLPTMPWVRNAVLSTAALQQFMAPLWSMKASGRKPRLKYHVPFGASHGITANGCKIEEATSTDDDRSYFLICMTLTLIADACGVPEEQNHAIWLHRRLIHNLVFTAQMPFFVNVPVFKQRHPEYIVPPKRTSASLRSRRRGRGAAAAVAAASEGRDFRGGIVSVPYDTNKKLRLLMVSARAVICAGCKNAQQNRDALLFFWGLIRQDLQAQAPILLAPSAVTTPGNKRRRLV